MAMSEPNQVQLKRKRNEEPLDVLLLQGGDRSGDRPAEGTRYVRQRNENDTGDKGEIEQPKQDTTNGQKSTRRPAPNGARRIFELQHKPNDASRKRKKSDDNEEDIATFVEKKIKHQVEAATERKAPEERSAPATPLKRPGKGSSLRTPTKPAKPAETEHERKQMEAMAAYMHEAALEELKTETRPKAVTTPKLSGARSREIHRQRAATNGSISIKSEMDLDDDDDTYVYDTYILAPATDVGAIQVDELGQLDNVGYLVITEDDRSLWETYLEDEPSEKDWNSDDDDENAEGYYAADYPDDEVFSDEDGLGGYGYVHRGAPNDEEWDQDTGAYSDDEYQIRNGQVPQRFREFEREAFGR